MVHNDSAKTNPEKDPTGGHDPKALDEAAKRMKATGSGTEDDGKDPERDHDEAALNEAAKKIGAEHQAD